MKKKQPQAQALIQKSAGYAVFNNMGTNLLLLSTARAAGIAINSQTKRETFMKMISAGAGLGLGVKDYRVVFVFENEKALTQFLESGWSGSAQTDAAAKVGESGGAYSGAAEVAPVVWVYCGKPGALCPLYQTRSESSACACPQAKMPVR